MRMSCSAWLTTPSRALIASEGAATSTTSCAARAPSVAVFFDLDGTLADTAGDLAAAANRMRADESLAPLPVERYRPFASAGARGMLHAAFGLAPEDSEYPALRETFLDYYAERVCIETHLFPGIAELLEEIRARELRWGIVTNKATRFTEPIVAALELAPDCVACGDTTAHLKPHPASLLHSAQALAVAPHACVYLGDDLRDMKAARAAGMTPIAVQWGYHHPEQGGPESWGAAAVIAHPLELIAHL